MFFLTLAGTALQRSGVEKVLRQLTTAMGIRTATCRPRAHDLRHRFAIATLIAWHQNGLDIDQHIAVLSTYLGHVAPSDTYWYLSATPELMALAARRLEKHLGARQ
jgi:integrase/recombinase XerD